MKYFSMLIKPASSSCNMKCSYCFYADVAAHRKIKNYGIMDEETMNSVIDKTLGYFHEEVTITYAFQGGEPTLAGYQFFERFVNTVNLKKKEVHQIQYAIQTNGLNLDETWIRFFKEHHFLVGVSLDGYFQHHDAMRKDTENKKTYERIMVQLRKLKAAEVEFNILTVLTSSLSQHASKLYQFYKKNELEYIQIIPCLPELGERKNQFSLQPKQFFEFYDVFYQLWLKDWKKGRAMSVSYFDNLIPLFAGILPRQCGSLGFCTNQFVVESNGNVYPCDFYVLDEHCIGNINIHTLQELATSQAAKRFLEEKRKYSQKCHDCKYKRICYGQCKRLAACYYDEHDCGLEQFMSKHEKTLVEVAATLR